MTMALVKHRSRSWCSQAITRASPWRLAGWQITSASSSQFKSAGASRAPSGEVADRPCSPGTHSTRQASRPCPRCGGTQARSLQHRNGLRRYLRATRGQDLRERSGGVWHRGSESWWDCPTGRRRGQFSDPPPLLPSLLLLSMGVRAGATVARVATVAAPSGARIRAASVRPRANALTWYGVSTILLERLSPRPSPFHGSVRATRTSGNFRIQCRTPWATRCIRRRSV